MRSGSIIAGSIVLGATVLLAIGLGILHTFSPYAEPANNLQLLGIGLSFITSVLLIGIYAILVIRQGDQNELQKGQQELMEASHEPVIQVLDVDSYGQFFCPKLRNIGNGPTKDMGAAIHFYVEDIGIEVNTGGDRLTHSADSEAVDMLPEEAAEIGSLSSGETGKLAAAIRVPNLDSEEKGRLGHLMNDFHDRDIEEVVYQIEVFYGHLMRTRGVGRQYLKLRKVEVQQHLGVDFLINHGEEYTKPELFESASNLREPGTYYEE